MRSTILTEAEIKNNLSKADGWAVDGKELKKRYEFSNFAESFAFVSKIAELAEKADHHPDIKFGWGFAEVFLTTHDVGGLTHNDFDIAQIIDNLPPMSG